MRDHLPINLFVKPIVRDIAHRMDIFPCHRQDNEPYSLKFWVVSEEEVGSLESPLERGDEHRVDIGHLMGLHLALKTLLFAFG
jgi:hypothetical protein